MAIKPEEFLLPGTDSAQTNASSLASCSGSAEPVLTPTGPLPSTASQPFTCFSSWFSSLPVSSNHSSQDPSQDSFPSTTTSFEAFSRQVSQGSSQGSASAMTLCSASVLASRRSSHSAKPLQPLQLMLIGGGYPPQRSATDPGGRKPLEDSPGSSGPSAPSTPHYVTRSNSGQETSNVRDENFERKLEVTPTSRSPYYLKPPSGLQRHPSGEEERAISGEGSPYSPSDNSREQIDQQRLILTLRQQHDAEIQQLQHGFKTRLHRISEAFNGEKGRLKREIASLERKLKVVTQSNKENINLIMRLKQNTADLEQERDRLKKEIRRQEKQNTFFKRCLPISFAVYAAELPDLDEYELGQTTSVDHRSPERLEEKRQLTEGQATTDSSFSSSSLNENTPLNSDSSATQPLRRFLAPRPKAKPASPAPESSLMSDGALKLTTNTNTNTSSNKNTAIHASEARPLVFSAVPNSSENNAVSSATRKFVPSQEDDQHTRRFSRVSHSSQSTTSNADGFSNPSYQDLRTPLNNSVYGLGEINSSSSLWCCFRKSP